MNDIVPELLEAIRDTYSKAVNSNQEIKDILKKIDKGIADYEDMLKLSKEYGNCLSKAFSMNISNAVLPDEKMYYNIARSLLEPTVFENYKTIAAHCAAVQKSLNSRAGLGINAIIPSYNQKKTDGIINYISNAEKYSDREKSFLNSLVTSSKSVVDDSVQQNAEFHYQSGLKPKIIRRTMGKTCKWCQNLAGIYDYADVRNTENDVFRRHANCDCTVVYDPGDGSKKVQDVWSKIWNDQSKADIIQKRLEKLEPTKYLGTDVTKEYYGTSLKKGKVVYDNQYKINDHKEEINIANLISSVFGDDVILLQEKKLENVKNPDYIWKNKLWDLKTLTTEKSADSAIRKGLKQIESNSGGIILDYRGKNINLDKLMKIVDARMKRGCKSDTDIMIILEKNKIKVFRYKK